MAKIDWETDGMQNGKEILCPSDDDQCPYLEIKKDGRGICHITNPAENCDDYAFYQEEE